MLVEEGAAGEHRIGGLLKVLPMLAAAAGCRKRIRPASNRCKGGHKCQPPPAKIRAAAVETEQG